MQQFLQIIVLIKILTNGYPLNYNLLKKLSHRSSVYKLNNCIWYAFSLLTLKFLMHMNELQIIYKC